MPLTIGTKSVLFGVHQFLWHPLTVYLAWVELYGRPNLKETVCILIHDWGYFGCRNMDGEEGGKHPEFAAKIAGKLLGKEYADMCLCHSRYYARQLGKTPSKLCYSDKLSIKFEVWWFYLFRARLSGELKEYRRNSAKGGYLSEDVSDRSWFNWIQNYLVGIGVGFKNHSVVSKLVK